MGGSATCDGGLGMLKALGYRFFDAAGNELSGIGKDLVHIHRIDSSEVLTDLKEVIFTAVCDVVNPLYGPLGAAYVFAPQKGARPCDLPLLDAGLENFTRIAGPITGNFKASELPGAGAAGGLGFSMFSFLNAKSKKGIDFVLDTLNFNELLPSTDLIITGEGKIDRQSLMGKVVSGILKRSQAYDIPVIAIAGKVEDKEELIENGVTAVFETADPRLSEEDNMEEKTAIKNLSKTIKTISKSNIFRHFL